MSNSLLKQSLLLCVALTVGSLSVSVAQEAQVALHGSLPSRVAQSRPLRRLVANTPLRFSLALPVRNQAGLDALLRSLYTPGDPLYHAYLKTGEFAARFGATQADYDAVIAYVKRQGLTIAETSPNRLLLQVTGSTAQIEKAFGVRMMRYQAAEGRLFHAPNAEPLLPASIAPLVSGIVGLDDALEPMSNLMARPANQPRFGPNGGGSGPTGNYAPSDIKTAYNLNGVSQTGSGQTIALFELDGYIAGDIPTYENQFGLPHVTVQNVLLDGVSGTPTAPTLKVQSPNGPAEVTLDIELAIALAPGATRILVYEGNNFVDIYNRIASDNLAQQVSSSWYPGRESDVAQSLRNSENTAFQQMATQGQSFYAASGDFGANVKTGTDSMGNPILKFGVQDPSSQPWCCGVGGTTLTTNGAGGTYKSEIAWAGSGGGISTIWPLPTYQSAVVSSGSGGSSSQRNVPDVSLDSNPSTGYAIYYSNVYNNGGGWTSYGGTSCAAPLWAAFTALVNQRRNASGLGQLGFPNPTLYYLAQSPAYASDFYDITSGSNGTYSAVAGYDNVTGWGSFNGGNVMGGLQMNGTAFYVNGNFTGSPQLGTRTNPYRTVTQAVNAAPANGVTLIYIRGFDYNEQLNITKHVLLINDGGGNVLIGK